MTTLIDRWNSAKREKELENDKKKKAILDLYDQVKILADHQATFFSGKKLGVSLIGETIHIFAGESKITEIHAYDRGAFYSCTAFGAYLTTLKNRDAAIDFVISLVKNN